MTNWLETGFDERSAKRAAALRKYDPKLWIEEAADLFDKSLKEKYEIKSSNVNVMIQDNALHIVVDGVENSTYTVKNCELHCWS